MPPAFTLNRRASSSRDFTTEDISISPGTAKASRMSQRWHSKHLVWSAVAKSSIPDYVTLLVLALITIWSETANPFNKVIYSGSDQELWRYSYPLHQQNTVPSWTVPVIATVGPLTVIAITSLLFQPTKKEVHSVVMGLLSAVFITATLTNLVKIGVGRPRPNFSARCWPDGQVKFSPTGEPDCAAGAIDAKEGRKSFPSGHTSWSTSGLGYLTLWLAGHLRCFDGSGHPVRLVLAGLPLCIAGWIGITRLQDYWHHWQDVLAGFVLGLTIAYLCYRQHFPALLGPKTGEAYAIVSLDHPDWDASDLEMGNRQGHAFEQHSILP